MRAKKKVSQTLAGLDFLIFSQLFCRSNKSKTWWSQTEKKDRPAMVSNSPASANKSILIWNDELKKSLNLKSVDCLAAIYTKPQKNPRHFLYKKTHRKSNPKIQGVFFFIYRKALRFLSKNIHILLGVCVCVWPNMTSSSCLLALSEKKFGIKSKKRNRRRETKKKKMDLFYRDFLEAKKKLNYFFLNL